MCSITAAWRLLGWSVSMYQLMMRCVADRSGLDIDRATEVTNAGSTGEVTARLVCISSWSMHLMLSYLINVIV